MIYSALPSVRAGLMSIPEVKGERRLHPGQSHHETSLRQGQMLTQRSPQAPELRKTMLDEKYKKAPPREQVRHTLAAVDAKGERFWGVDLLWTRKRTVEDAVLQYYYDTVRASL